MARCFKVYGSDVPVLWESLAAWKLWLGGAHSPATPQEQADDDVATNVVPFLPSRHRRHGTASALKKAGHLEAFIRAIQVSTSMNTRRAEPDSVRSAFLGTGYSAGRDAATQWTATTTS